MTGTMLSKRFPVQKIGISSKNDEWKRKCIDAGINLTIFNFDSRIRDSKENMRANYNLWNGYVDPKDVERTINPYGIETKDFPKDIPHFSIINNKFNVLIGEESRRTFNYSVMITNEDAISEKREYIKKEMLKKMMSIASAPGLTEDQIKEGVAKLEKWAKYDALDLREVMATKILKYYFNEQKLGIKFNSGFKDALITGEEIYNVDVYGGKLMVRNVSPLTLYVYGLGTSNRIEDADIIVEDRFRSVADIIDDHYDELKPSEIDRLERGNLWGDKKQQDSGMLNYPQPDFGFLGAFNPDNMIDTNYLTAYGTSAYYDTEGNIRETIVTWRSRRKLGIIEYEDDNGYLQRELVDENIKLDPNLGIKIKWVWVNEWWQGTKIGKDIYVKVGPRDIQPRDIDNISLSMCPYVGNVYNTGISRVKSMMDLAKPYSYMFDAISYKMMKVVSRYNGPIQEMDFSKKPDGWTADKWLYFMEEFGKMFVDSFAENAKRPGTFAGTFNTTGKILNPELGNYIRDNIEFLRYIKDELSEATGITRQREGAIDNRETVGGVERSVTQSSHATEEKFMIHDDVKLRVLAVILETAKYLLFNKSKLFQFITDDKLSSEIFSIDGNQFFEASYGIVLVNSMSSTKLKNDILSLAQAGLQNQLLNFSQFMDLYMSDDVVSVRRKFEQFELEAQQRQQEASKAQQEHEQQLLQMELESREDQQAHEIEVETLKSNTQIELKLMELAAEEDRLSNDSNSNNDNSEALLKLQLEREKLAEEKKSRDKEFNLKLDQFRENVRQAKIAEKQKEQEISIKRKVANKPNSTSK